jgi:hypothetical protein
MGRTWTDLEALAAAVLRTTSREEALALVHEAPTVARPVMPEERVADPVAVAGARAARAVCRPGPERPRSRDAQEPLFARRGGG